MYYRLANLWTATILRLEGEGSTWFTTNSTSLVIVCENMKHNLGNLPGIVTLLLTKSIYNKAALGGVGKFPN